ncbi:MAG TPA: bifunctional diaminohydroxyphosphoribosylaminopyrimidine deaminase/5-amino-6-(5-phosphoribosylamino)uracil reductase RibD [Negativicutes bacterium]|nr:bifunctional diaminohydroxyphosphoribosylaminopyrimidine deaminase/5-amino-6-(5-phosphoribosylamino)uracil reductase RibD [Negativicutes bacterium]
MHTVIDEQYMKEALLLARKGRGRTSPNPVVGAVIVKDGIIVGRGWHQKAGTAHAEIHALADAGCTAENATIYVTLEPCCHHGRTGPCAEALIAAGITRVVVAMVDPNPLVAGCGIELLRNHGISVDTGVLSGEAANLNAPFIKWITCKLPFVTMKNGISLDGKIATHTGNSRWITSEASRLEVHRMRDASDAIITGIGTVLADDPELTTRLPEGGKSPIRVVVDRLARTPLNAKLVVTAKNIPTIIAVSTDAPPDHVANLEAHGVEILRIPAIAGRLDLGALLRNLGQRCLTSVMVEAGGTLNSSFLFGNYVDRVVLFVAPKIIGGAGAPGPYGGEGSDLLSDAVDLEDLVVRNLGEDLMIEGYVKRRENRDVYRTCGGIR